MLNASDEPITVGVADARSQSPDQLALHTYGKRVRHEAGSPSTTRPSTAPRRSTRTLAAKAANGTPFKRPENGALPAGREFRSSTSTRPATPTRPARRTTAPAAGGSVFKLTQSDPSANTGKLRLFYKGDQAHAGFDNVAFLSRDLITFVEDAGDTLHGQRERARLRLPVRRDRRDYSNPATSRSAGWPKAATPRRRSTPPTPASARTTATTRSPASRLRRRPVKAGILGAKSAAPVPARDEQWRLAGLLHPAARRQPDLRGREAVTGTGRPGAAAERAPGRPATLRRGDGSALSESPPRGRRPGGHRLGGRRRLHTGRALRLHRRHRHGRWAGRRLLPLGAQASWPATSSSATSRER